MEFIFYRLLSFVITVNNIIITRIIVLLTEIEKQIFINGVIKQTFIEIDDNITTTNKNKTFKNNSF